MAANRGHLRRRRCRLAVHKCSRKRIGVLGEMMERHVRHDTEEDVEVLAALAARANATYQKWADAGWRPPGLEHERSRWRERFDDPVAWNAVALCSGECLGCVSFTDARAQEGHGRRIRSLAHLSRMFVDPENWGHGIASLLLNRAVDEMRNRGYQQAQLFTPDKNVRSRRFYERHAWRPGEEIRRWRGLVLIRYSLDL
jgi:GNAT superfamily N-acetyltransferase